MLQTVLIVIIFASACYYMGRLAYRNLTSKDCHCGSCGDTALREDIKKT